MENKSSYFLVDLGVLSGVMEKESFGVKGKFFAGEQLGLTGCEVSYAVLPARQSIPFLHSHKENEEVYLFISGNGTFLIDGQKLPVKEGSIVKVSPSGKRGLKANGEDLLYICIQAKENSLKQATVDDGIIFEDKPEW